MLGFLPLYCQTAFNNKTARREGVVQITESAKLKSTNNKDQRVVFK